MKTFFEFQKKREFFSSQKILFFSSIFNPSGLTHQNKSEAVKMSRHRNMKYITEEAFDEMYDEGYDEYYDEGIDQVELGKLKNEKMTFLHIFAVIFNLGDYRKWIPDVVGSKRHKFF